MSTKKLKQDFTLFSIVFHQLLHLSQVSSGFYDAYYIIYYDYLCGKSFALQHVISFHIFMACIKTKFNICVVVVKPFNQCKTFLAIPILNCNPIKVFSPLHIKAKSKSEEGKRFGSPKII